MKILIVTQYFWPENFRINDLAIALKARGHDVVVLAGIPNYPSGRFFKGYGWFSPTRERWEGISIIRCPIIPRGKGGGLRLAINYASYALSASLLGPWLCRGQFDVVFAYEPSPITVALPALLLGRLRKMPVLLWVLDLWPESVTAAGSVKSPFILRMIDRMVRFIYRRCDLILVQSRAFIERIRAQEAAAMKIRYFPNWAESIFTQSPTGESPFELPDGFRVVFAGNIGAAQDFEAILQAAERVREEARIHWVIVGDGRMAGWLRSEIQSRRLTGTVHLMGSHPLEAMPALFASADAMLVTLKEDPIFSLTIPGKIQSYLACGRPVIGMLDGEGAKVLQESGAALVGPAGDSGTLADNVLALYRQSHEKRQLMGQSGREYYLRHFERNHLMSQLEQWLSEVHGPKPPHKSA